MKTNRFFCLLLAFMLFAVGCKKKPTSTSKSLHWAASEGDIKMVETFIRKGADVNARDDWNGSTPLHKAASSGHKDVAEFLIAKGAYVNARTTGFMTPLHYATEKGYKEITELLIAHGADVNVKRRAWPAGDTPLHSAVRARHKDIVELLITNGADVNAKDGSGDTCLHFIAKSPIRRRRILFGGFSWEGDGEP